MGAHGRPQEATTGHGRPWEATGGYGRPRGTTGGHERPREATGGHGRPGDRWMAQTTESAEKQVAGTFSSNAGTTTLSPLVCTS